MGHFADFRKSSICSVLKSTDPPDLSLKVKDIAISRLHDVNPLVLRIVWCNNATSSTNGLKTDIQFCDHNFSIKIKNLNIRELCVIVKVDSL